MERFEADMHFQDQKNKLNRRFLVFDSFDKIPVNDYLYLKYDKTFTALLEEGGKYLIILQIYYFDY